MSVSDPELPHDLGRMPFADTAELAMITGEAHVAIHRALTGLLADGIVSRVSQGIAYFCLTRPDGSREQARLQGHPAVSAKGEYQAGKEARITISAVYELTDGSKVYSAAATLSCTVAE